MAAGARFPIYFSVPALSCSWCSQRRQAAGPLNSKWILGRRGGCGAAWEEGGAGWGVGQRGRTMRTGRRAGAGSTHLGDPGSHQQDGKHRREEALRGVPACPPGGPQARACTARLVWGHGGLSGAQAIRVPAQAMTSGLRMEPRLGLRAQLRICWRVSASPSAPPPAHLFLSLK